MRRHGDGQTREKKRPEGKPVARLSFRTDSPKLERHFGLKAAAAIIGVPFGTLKTWVARGYIARTKAPGLRGRILLRESDIVDFLDRQREPARADIEDELRRAESSPPRPIKNKPSRRDSPSTKSPSKGESAHE